MLHYYLSNRSNRILNEEELDVIKSLSELEISLFFSLTKRKSMSIISQLSCMIKYQRAKLNSDNALFWHYRKKTHRYYRLYSDAAKFKQLPLSDNKNTAISLISGVNRRLAIIWSLRFDINIPEKNIIMEHPDCMRIVINKLISSLN